MAAAQRAIPSHLRDGIATNGEGGAFKRNHHGKSQSHVAHGSACTLVSKQSMNIAQSRKVVTFTRSFWKAHFGDLQAQCAAPISLNTHVHPSRKKSEPSSTICVSVECLPIGYKPLESVEGSTTGARQTKFYSLLPHPSHISILYLPLLSTPKNKMPTTQNLGADMAFENASTSVAAGQMRNALNALAETCKDEEEKERFETEMDNFFGLFRRYLNDKAKGNALSWDRIAPPHPKQVVDYNDLANSDSVEFLNKLAVIKLNGGLGTSMGCVGPKSVIEVRDGMSFLDLSVRQIEYLNRTYSVNVPFVLMNSFNTDEDTQNIIKKYEGHGIDIMTFNQSRYPRVLRDSLLPAPKKYDSQISDWYPPGHGDVFESLYNSGILEKLIDRGVEIIFLSNADNLGAVCDLRILQHMVQSESEYIMELTDKTKADVKGGTIIDYEGSVRLLEIAQVPKQYTNEFKSIKKFKYFNTNNIWLNLKAIKRVVENNELAMEIIPNNKSIPADKKGEADVNIVQLETAVGAAIRHFKNAHGVNVPRRRFLPVKTCSDLMLVKSDLYSLKHGQLVIDDSRDGPAPLIKLGNDFKKVSDFQKRVNSIPKILELDHLTITGAVNLGRGVVLKGTVIIVATEGSTIDIPPGSILENVVVQGSLRLLEH